MNQTSLEQIFNQFAAQQEEEQGAVRGMHSTAAPPPKTQMQFVVPEDHVAGSTVILQTCAPRPLSAPRALLPPRAAPVEACELGGPPSYTPSRARSQH